MISLILTLAGSAVFVPLFFKYREIVSNVDQKSTKFHWMLLFIITYIFLLIGIYNILADVWEITTDYNLLVSEIFFLGAIYAYSLIYLSVISIRQAREEKKFAQELKKSSEFLSKSRKEMEQQISKRTQELNDKIKELTETKTAILNMMEDTDETNKQLTVTQSELKKNMEKLKELDKKKDEFISIAAHELKTPLTSIHGFSQLLQDNTIIKDDEKRGKYLRIVDKETNRLARLVTDILDLSRIDLGTFKLNQTETDPNRMLDDLFKEMNVQAKNSGLKLDFEIEGSLPKVFVDRERLIQVLMNLINNSVKYTPKGSINLKAFVENDSIHFMVKDTGIGISKENHDKIFERFFQVDSTYTRKSGGTGLGLALSKEYVTAMGGKIWFNSELGKGSEFHFTIPINMVQK